MQTCYLTVLIWQHLFITPTKKKTVLSSLSFAFQEVKHKILFLLEMLEPFLDPAIYASKSTIAFGDVSFTFLEKQEQTCVIALNVIRTAVQKPAVLPSLESEWRRGSVASRYHIPVS